MNEYIGSTKSQFDFVKPNSPSQHMVFCVTAERFGEIIELRLFRPILRFSMRFFFFKVPYVLGYSLNMH